MLTQPPRFLQALTGAALIILASTSVQAADWTVTASGDSGSCPGVFNTLRGALCAANDGDTIKFNGDITINVTAEMEINKNITIDGSGHTVIIDGNSVDENENIFKITNGTTATLDRLIIQNAPSSANAIRATGNNTEVIVRNSTVRYSKRTALFIVSGAQLTLENSFVLNSSRQGIYVEADDSHATIKNSVISENGLTGHMTVKYQGINLVADSSADIINSTITGNGAGISAHTLTNPGTKATVTINNSTISDNIEYGINLTRDSVANAYYSTIANNGEYGVNAEIDSKSLFQHVTFAGNGSGGVHVPSGDTELMLINSLVADGCNIGMEAGIIDQGGNIEAGNTCYFNNSSSISGAGLAALNLGPLQNNDGPTPTILPGVGSPGVDYVNCIGGHEYDQRGIELPQGERCDVGAVELRSGEGWAGGGDSGDGPNVPGDVRVIPTLGQWSLMLLTSLLGVAAARRMRRSA